MAPGVDWSQFEVEAAPAPPGGSEVDWSQFEPEAAPSFDDVESGNETTAPVNFGNVIHGSNSQPLRQFSGIDRVRDAISAVPEALGAAFSGERYADTDTDPRRLVGVAEGAGRTFGEDLATMGVTALENVPGPLMAYTLYKRARGEETPADQYAGAVNQTIGVNDATMQFESPRAEMAARVLGHAAGAAVPLGPVGSAARVERTAALAGHLGPEVQGAAVADDILAAAPKPPPTAPKPREDFGVPTAEAPAIPILDSRSVSAPRMSGSDAAQFIENRMSALDHLSADGRLTSEEVKGLSAQDEAIRKQIEQQLQYRNGLVPARAELRLSDDQVGALSSTREKIRQAIEGNRTARAHETNAQAIRDRLGKIDEDSDLINYAEELRGFRPSKIEGSEWSARGSSVSPEQQATQVAVDIGATPTAAPERPTLYHASLAPDITEFRTGHEGTRSDSGILGRGTYFDGDATRAGYYLGPKRKEGTLYGVDAGMENPAVFDSPKAAQDFAGEMGTTPEASERIRQKFLAAGHDGVIVQNPETGQVIHAVSFVPERAKITERRPIGAPPETPHASEVRSDTGQPGIAREAAAGSEADRSGDLQRAEEAGPSAGDGQPRTGADGAVQDQGPLTGVKNRVVAEERHARGMDELDYEGRRTFPEDWEPAKEAFKADESIGNALAHSIVERPRALSGREVATLSMERARLAKMHREGMADIAHAMESGDIEAETIARGRLRETEGQLEVADRAAKASGYEGGFGLAARRMLSKEDYSLAELVTEAKVRKGGELTPKDRAHLESIAARIDGVEQELAAVRAQAMKKATRRAPKSVQDQYDALREQLKAIPKKEHTLCGVA